MQVANDLVVRFDYTLTGPDGRKLDTSEGREPLAYLHGRHGIIPGLEAAMNGRNSGESFDITIPAAQAYGERDQRAVQQVPRSAFQGVADIQPGMQFQARGPQGQTSLVTVAAVTPDTITVDANHPLAGVDLTFAINIIEIRPATPEELSHGHVHGPGGHHH